MILRKLSRFSHQVIKFKQMAKISVVINTFNEEKNLPMAIASVKDLADEIVVVDMESRDGTVEIAKELGAKVYSYKRVGYVEPARNFAISKTIGDWVLILDADEEVSQGLSKSLKKIAKKPTVDFYRISRKNVIFGKWIKHTLWWPDYQIRFFKKGFVSWGDEIHSFPITQGKGASLPEKEVCSIIHHNYDFLDQYIERLFRYTKIQAEEFLKNGYVFNWKDMINKPLNEFLRRFFEGEGYKDGIHGFILSILQSFSELVVYIRVWEKQGFREKEIGIKEYREELGMAMKDFTWWTKKKFSWLRLLKFR